MKSICWTNRSPERYLINIGAGNLRRTPPAPPAQQYVWKTIMALSLPGERTPAAATPLNPFAAFTRWIVKAQAARTRRVALSALLDLDHAGLDDLGISRDDVVAAIAAPVQGGRLLNTARARRARG
jgi:uncharacterized protein YjiS (DUF1127 family)